MGKRLLAGLGMALALVLLLPVPDSQAQERRNWRRSAPPGVSVERRPPSRVPNYYLDRRGPVATPRGPVPPGDVASSLRARGFRDIGPLQRRGRTVIVPRAVGPSGEAVQLVIGPNGEILGVRVLPGGR